jgi:hypothetical protein
MQQRTQGFVFSLGMFTLFLLAIMARPSFAQESEDALSKNSLYLELGGNALVYSINYDRILSNAFSVRGGIGYYSLEDDLEGGDNSVSLAAFPLTLNYLLGSGSSRLELGAGLVILTGSADLGGVSTSNASVIGTATFAYRYQKPMGGIFFKAGFTPFISGGSFIPWFGLSVGYTL